MTVGEAMSLVKTISFLNFKFEVKPMSPEDAWLIISFKAPDTRDRTKELELNFQQMLSNLHAYTTREFILFVYDCVQKCLKHEASELFKVDGIDVFNEHEIGKAKMRMVEQMFPYNKQMMERHYWAASDKQRQEVWEMKGKMQQMEENYLGYGI